MGYFGAPFQDWSLQLQLELRVQWISPGTGRRAGGRRSLGSFARRGLGSPARGPNSARRRRSRCGCPPPPPAPYADAASSCVVYTILTSWPNQISAMRNKVRQPNPMSGKTNQCKEHLLPASCSRIATLAAGESRAGETAAHAIGLRERGGCGAVGVCTIGYCCSSWLSWKK